jgi:diaminopimelate epimerase
MKRKFIPFIKMHGAGNDFVFVTEDDLGRPPAKQLVRRLLDRHFGIGGDQLLYLKRSNGPAPYELLFFNADGSQAEMCGNGIRAAAAHLVKHNRAPYRFSIKTKSGFKNINAQSGVIDVDMGFPILEGRKIPVRASGEIIGWSLKVAGKTYFIHGVSMGNPHAVIFVKNVERFPVREIGPLIEYHPFFPKRVNVEFVQVISKNHVKARVWERGAGETLACGSGACAIQVAAARAKKTSRRLAIDLPGGRLFTRWSDNDHVFLSGPENTVYEGRFYV